MNTAQQRLADDQEFLASLTDRSCFSSFPLSRSFPSCMPSALLLYFPRPLCGLPFRRGANAEKFVATILSEFRRLISKQD